MNEATEALLKRLLELTAGTDSLEVGTPAKGGTIKVYGNFDDPTAFERKLNAAIGLRELAQKRMAGEPAPAEPEARL